MKFAYADPPYRGCCGRYDHYHPDGLCWDDLTTHVALIGRLAAEYPDGWALSCNPRDLRELLPAAPFDVRVAAWCKTWHQIRPTTVQFAWEPVIWCGGRKDPKRTPMVRDWVICAATRGTGTVGAKPAQFNQWVLDLLGYDPDLDTLTDLYPGSAGMAVALAASPLTFGSTA